MSEDIAGVIASLGLAAVASAGVGATWWFYWPLGDWVLALLAIMMIVGSFLSVFAIVLHAWYNP